MLRPTCDLLLMLMRCSPMAALGDTSPPKNPRSDGYGFNPRCIKRDLSNYLTQRDATTAKIASLITGTKDIATFQSTMQSGTGVHQAGHFTISGDPGSGTSINSSPVPHDPRYKRILTPIAQTSTPPPATRPSGCTTPRSTAHGPSGKRRTSTSGSKSSPAEQA